MAVLPQEIDDRINQNSVLQLDQRFLVANLGDFFEQRAGIGIDAFSDLWTLSIGPVDKSELDIFRNFWNIHGFVESFDWTAPEDSSQKKWVFNTKPNITNIAEHYFIEVDVRQVRE